MYLYISINKITLVISTKYMNKIKDNFDYYVSYIPNKLNSIKHNFDYCLSYIPTKFNSINYLYEIKTNSLYELSVKNLSYLVDNIRCVNDFYLSEYTFVPFTYSYDYLLFLFIGKLFYSKLFKLSLVSILWVLYYYGLPALGSVVYILYTMIRLFLLYMQGINKWTLIMIFILLFSSYANGYSVSTISLDNIFLILATIGNFFFVLVGILFDYFSYLNSVHHGTIYINPLISKIILGGVYFTYIMTGVFSSNGVWFYSSERTPNLLPGTIFTGIFTVAFSLIWYTLNEGPDIRRFTIINCIFRALADSIAFNCIAWHTYYLWELWVANVYNYDILAMAIFIPLHLVSSCYTIYLEVSGNSLAIIYGFMYYISFGSACLGVNGLYSIISIYINSNIASAFTILGLGILTSILYPDIYRNILTSRPVDIELHNLTESNSVRNQIRPRNTFYANRSYILISLIRYFLLIICFIITSGLLFRFIQ